MHSWVRYSVAVYLGLLLAGALVGPQPQVSAGSQASGPRQLAPLADRPVPQAMAWQWRDDAARAQK